VIQAASCKVAAQAFVLSKRIWAFRPSGRAAVKGDAGMQHLAQLAVVSSDEGADRGKPTLMRFRSVFAGQDEGSSGVARELPSHWMLHP
jgi:hypothetical protein